MKYGTKKNDRDLLLGKLWNKILATISIINIIVILHHLFTRLNQVNNSNINSKMTPR